MACKIHRLLCFGIIFCACTAEVPETELHDTFSSVTAFQGLTSLYLRMKIREPHLYPDTETDAATKTYICQSITGSVYFKEHFKEDAVDMENVYADLTSRMENEVKDLPPSKVLAGVIQDYEEGRFTFRTRLTRFHTDGGDREEYAFACATKDHNANDSINVYYISDAYNVRTALDVPTDGQTFARFVCLVIASRCQLVALAEEPSFVFPAFNYPAMSALQNIYRRMRRVYTVALKESDDPLCKLTRSEKLRACASVLNAPYFNYKAEFKPHQSAFEGKCVLQEVALLIMDYEETDVVHHECSTSNKRCKEEGKSIAYYEWMLPCPVEPTMLDDRTGEPTRTYFLSRAYNSHHVIVYSPDFWTGETYIEGISINIAVLIDRSGSGANDDTENEETPPSLMDLLETEYATILNSSDSETEEKK